MRSLFISASAMLIGGCAAALPATVDPNRSGLPIGEDSCGAAAFAGLIGQPVGAAHTQLAGRNHRVIGDGDAVTMDFSPQRLNVHYDKRSGRIIGIKCG